MWMAGFFLLPSGQASCHNECVYDKELIYARVIGLLTSSREIDFNDVLAIELAAYPPSMFNADGKTNDATSNRH